MHSELSEALEAVRIGNPRSGKIGPDFDQFTEELADCVIRIFDECHQEGKDIGGAILAKMAYNRTRPHRHGGKLY
jgi:NTP pyrophosphatase (non-canonical NTP hydrolase)